MASVVQFKDILLGSVVPLHPYLGDSPHIFLRLTADDSIYGESSSLKSDPTTGILETNSTLCAHSVKQSVTLAVMVIKRGLMIRLAFVELSAADLTRIKARSDGYHEFMIGNPESIQLVMTCLVNVLPSLIMNSPSSHAGSHDIQADHTVDSHTKNTQSSHEPNSSELPSREDMESDYANVIRIPDQDKKAHMLSQLGSAYFAYYQETTAKADLEKAISMHEEAMQCTGLLHPQLAEHAHELAATLVERFEQGGDLIDVERAISHYQTAVEATDDLDENKPRRLSDLGDALELRFQRLGDVSDLESAITFKRKGVELALDGHPDSPVLFNSLGSSLRTRFEHLSSLTDLEDAISNQRKAVELTPSGRPDKPGWLNNLGNALQTRFERLGSLADLEDAISNMRKAVELTPDGYSDGSILFNNLGDALHIRFEHLGSLTDLEDAISNKRKAIDLTPSGHPDHPSRLNNLGIALHVRFEHLGSLADLEDAISNMRNSVELTPNGHPSEPRRLTNLGVALKTRFKRLGSLTDLDDAISNQRKAVELTPNGHPEKPGRLSNLGNSLQTQFKHLGSLTDLEDAISNKRKAVELTPSGHPDKPGWLNNLGISLQTRFEHLGSLADLEDAISNNRKAIELAPDGHPYSSALFNNLGKALQIRFDHLGSLTDLEDAISNQRKAIELTPIGHPDRPGRLNNLGGALQARFEHLGSLADLEDAISNGRKAVELTPNGHPDKPGRFSNLGNVLQIRFKQLGSLTDLEDAILNLRKGVELTPDGHPGSPNLFNNLGNALQTRFEHLGSVTDLEEAISNMRKAIELTPNGHPNRPGRLSSLGVALGTRFRHLGDLADLEDAISNFRQAAELTPNGLPGRPNGLKNLGNAFLDRFKRLGILGDLESALSAFSTATNSTNGSAMIRFEAARQWAKVAEEHSRSPLDAFSCAIDLLPRIAWLGLPVTDQHALLADVGSIVRDAVAAAITYEEYETAVIWAEQGRSIVWQNLLGLRNSVDGLREAYPELANRLRRIAAQLEGSESHESLGGKEPATPAQDISHKYSKLALEWENLVDEIRSLPTFEGFLRAKTFRQLAPAAHEGPVVILNINDVRCDALVLIADDSVEGNVSTVSIPLERFSHEKSKRMFESLTELLSSAGVRERNGRKTGRAQSRVDSDAKFKVILRILWEDVVKPVIDGLAFRPVSSRPPRIWWCTTGVLAFLPIHAAGVYDTQEVGEKVSDYVVSSYTPTLTAILEPSGPVMQTDFQVLTVAQASAPGAPPIPKTEEEVKIVQNLVASARILNLANENATVERVREGMMESNWIHLACHGKQNSDNPMESGFLLHDRMFKLSEIVKMSLPKTDFAFLSACQTAMGDEKLAEESVHLAAGMFLSGCRGVIATTWSIRDNDAPKIAQEVYSRMFKDGQPNRMEAAYALQEAVKLLRESGAPCTSWVPFIHIGR